MLALFNMYFVTSDLFRLGERLKLQPRKAYNCTINLTSEQLPTTSDRIIVGVPYKA